MVRVLRIAVGLAAVLAGVSACSSAGSAPSSSPATAGPTANARAATPTVTVSPSVSPTAAAMVKVENTSLGQILVDGHGRTLYLFKADTGTTSTCNGTCAEAWPPLVTAGKPTGTGVNESLLGTSTRSGGWEQVTYHGHPLYHFIEDTAPGQTKGQGVNAFGALWYVVSPSGNAITTASTSAATGSPSASATKGSGY